MSQKTWAENSENISAGNSHSFLLIVNTLTFTCDYPQALV